MRKLDGTENKIEARRECDTRRSSSAAPPALDSKIPLYPYIRNCMAAKPLRPFFACANDGMWSMAAHIQPNM